MKSLFTLKNKLVLLFLVLALVPLAVIGGFSIKTTEALIESLVVRQLENIAADKAAILERWLEERKQDLQVIAGTSLLKSMEPRLIAPYFESIQRHYGVYNDITMVSAEKELIVSTTPSGIIPVSAEDMNMSAGKSLCMSPISYLPKHQESTFRIAAPVFDGGRFIGTVFGTVGTHKIITIVLRVSLGETGECYLVDKDGTFLAHKEPSRILVENISQSESFKNIFGSHDRNKAYLDYRNIEVLGTSRKIGGTDWYIVVEQDRDEAFQSMDILKRRVFFTILFAISSALVLMWVLSYHIVRPVRHLSRSANTLAKADFNPDTLDTSRRDEIGALFRAFADMARKIQERQDLLEEKINLKAAELKETDYTLKQFQLIAERSEKFAALGRLGAAVAHEIRTPLTSLKLFLESIQTEIEISPEYSEDFNVGMEQITRIEAAINRLLDFTKPKELIITRIPVKSLITGIVSLIRPLANKQECAVKTHIADSLPDITADKKLLEEALINLFINSLEAMPEKGRIDVTAKLESLDAEINATSYIRIDIRDSGPGIAPEDIDFIFEPFFTTKSAGTGLGLPMVLSTVKRHEGEILVKNRENGGSEISLLLPVKSDTNHGKNITH
ncbi:MAG: cache domain-containing protein [Desulfobacterales bacterium]